MTERRTPIREQQTAIYRQNRARRQAPPPPLHIPARAAEPPQRRRIWPAVLLFFLLLALCGGLATATAAWAYQREKIMPGVSTLDLSLGGLTVEDAARRLESSWGARRARLLADGAPALALPLTELGIILDAEATARAAYREGRDLQRPEQLIQATLGVVAVQPIWYFDPAAARASLSTLAPRFEIPPLNAGVELRDGRVHATAPQAGQRLNVEATVAWLQQNAVQVATGEPLPLSITTVEPQITDVSRLVEELNQRISAPLVIHAFDPLTGETEALTIAAADWASWMKLEPGPESDPAAVSWSVDSGRVAQFVTQQNEGLGARYLQVDAAGSALAQAVQTGQHEVRLRLYHNDRQHTVQSGETLSSIAFNYGIPYPWIQQANPQLGDTLAVGQVITVPSPDVLLPLPIVENKRVVVSISQQRMWAYEDGALKWEWLVSTGIDSSPTAPGVFQIQSHEPNAYASIWDLWMPQFMGIYRPVPTSDFMNGFHGFPTRNGVNLLWTNSLGRKVTYGCILLSNENIDLLYAWADRGVIVDVRP